MAQAYYDAVQQCLGADVAAYAKNKRTGGNNGKKGARYEDFFAAKHVLDEVLAQLAAPGALGWPTLEEQADALVDDLVMYRADRTDYYQLKNSAVVSWTGGDHPIEKDFADQVTLANYQVMPSPATHLVVPEPQLRQTLHGNMPQAIQHHSTVEHFPYFEGSVNLRVQGDLALQSKLKILARTEEPELDQLADVFSALLYGLIRADWHGPVDQIYLVARRQMRPGLLALLPDELRNFHYMEGFTDVLANIPGLAYGCPKGFFDWRADESGTSGILSCDCLSDEFLKFQRRVIDASPRTFDDFEELLP